jgi:ribonuclease-3
MSTDLDILQKRLGYSFQDTGLLLTALTHSSFLNENTGGQQHNERLEFLGDAVLELVVSRELYTRFPHSREGQLTRMRARLVREKSLAELARELGLVQAIRLGRGEENQGGRQRDALLADCCEAVFGAVFVDGGFSAAAACVLDLFSARWPESPVPPVHKDYKTHLQELTQEHYRQRPVYTQVSADGPEHDRVYTVAVTLPGKQSYQARGTSVKKAQQSSALAALEALGWPLP